MANRTQWPMEQVWFMDNLIIPYTTVFLNWVGTEDALEIEEQMHRNRQFWAENPQAEEEPPLLNKWYSVKDGGGGGGGGGMRAPSFPQSQASELTRSKTMSELRGRHERERDSLRPRVQKSSSFSGVKSTGTDMEARASMEIVEM